MRGRPGSKVTVNGIGSGTWTTEYEGSRRPLRAAVSRRDLSAMSEKTPELVRRFLVEGDRPECGGAWLNAAALCTRIEPALHLPTARPCRSPTRSPYFEADRRSRVALAHRRCRRHRAGARRGDRPRLFAWAASTGRPPPCPAARDSG
ncbi:hypothetical protein LV779_27925 [Streptomyces thinghirensis]|nr:hypothetical protein [Streptomyces thinghirensis]